jgi:cytoskeletal protein RodZ
MHQSLGARLRQRREQQQISLATIAEQTKIKASLLEELERDDISHWPIGIFRRSFIRAYAQIIGLEPAVVLEEFLTLHPDPIEVAAVDASDLTVEGPKQHTRPPTRLRFLVGSALGSLARGREVAVSTPASPVPGWLAPEPVSVVGSSAEPAAEEREVAVSTPASTAPEWSAADPVSVAGSSLEPPTQEREDPVSAPASAVAESVAEEPVTVPTAFEPDLLAAARLCTALSRVDERSEMAPLLAEVARILDAIGLIIWIWDPRAVALRAVLAHGYPESLLAQLPLVKRTSDNATAAAFRSSDTRIVEGSDRASGAVVVPLMTPGGCGGVLAVEVPNGREQGRVLRGVATIFAAQLARWIRDERQADVADRRLA